MGKKFLKYTLIAAAAIVALAACVKNHTTVVNQIVADSVYEGTFYVDKSFSKDSTVIFLEFPDNSDKANISLIAVRLSSSETEFYTIGIEGLSYSATSSKITLTGDNIVPTVSGEAKSDLTIKNFQATVDSNADPERIVFTMTMGTHEVSYTGALIYKKYIE